MPTENIIVRGAREHNLKNIDVTIPRDKFIVITGVSGSGKSSLAFDTIYAEGQRKYVESLSSYARQFLEQMQKPDIDSIEGLSPSISIEQRTTSKNPRSTVGTVTEIYDYLRVLFARIGKPFCYSCGKPIQSQSINQITGILLELKHGTKIHVLAPVVRGRKGEYRKLLHKLRSDGYVRARIDGNVVNLADPISLEKNLRHDIDLFVDRLVIKPGVKNRLVDSIELASGLSDGLVKVETPDNNKEEMIFSQQFSCINCGISYPEIEPRIFSFNNPHGACPDCSGLGYNMVFIRNLIVSDPSLSIVNGAFALWPENIPDVFFQMLQSVAGHFRFNLKTPFKDLTAEQQSILFNGSKGDIIKFTYRAGSRTYSNHAPFPGILYHLLRRYRETESEHIRSDLEKFMRKSICSSCKGHRLKKTGLHVKINKRNISEICSLPIRECHSFFEEIKLSPFDLEIGEKLIFEIKSRLSFLINVGLDYLSLSRSAATLSGGEGQRIRLATQIGSSLVGVLYILDEPSIGLHQRDNKKLLRTLQSLRDLGNTVIVVEHDRDTIESADHIIDMGPGAGVSGGHIVADGSLENILQHDASLTASYLTGKKHIPVPRSRRKPAVGSVRLTSASLHNLKNINIDIPCESLTCVTGVSGSGKSSLVVQTLYPAMKNILYKSSVTNARELCYKSLNGVSEFEKIIDVDQGPIGRTPRSNPATYSGLFTALRELFASLPEAKARGYRAGRFSFNVKGGRCETCNGDGLIRVEMHFLPDHYITCDCCRGNRYNPETLEIRYRGKNISDVLHMTVEEALSSFSRIPAIRKKLQTLHDVGLGYITLGQSATTLSGGEAQRLKLARELGKTGIGKNFYILDEPTTGLHFDDIRKLLEVLHSLVDKGNTMVIIEHNMDVIKTADYIIDLGPEGGEKGGYVVANGTPEKIAATKKSYTGQFLKKILNQ